jgi:hypothetical protein
MKKAEHRRRGSTLVEFTLIGIPLIFVLISIFELSRGMWVYHTLAQAVRQGTRYASVHGDDCGTLPHACQITISQIAQRIQDFGVGLDPNELTLTFDLPADVAGGSKVGPALLSALLANSTVWPSGAASMRDNTILVFASYRFRSALSFFWPGAGPGMNFGTFYFTAVSEDRIQF